MGGSEAGWPTPPWVSLSPSPASSPPTPRPAPFLVTLGLLKLRVRGPRTWCPSCPLGPGYRREQGGAAPRRPVRFSGGGTRSFSLPPAAVTAPPCQGGGSPSGRPCDTGSPDPGPRPHPQASPNNDKREPASGPRRRRGQEMSPKPSPVPHPSLSPTRPGRDAPVSSLPCTSGLYPQLPAWVQGPPPGRLCSVNLPLTSEPRSYPSFSAAPAPVTALLPPPTGCSSRTAGGSPLPRGPRARRKAELRKRMQEAVK